MAGGDDGDVAFFGVAVDGEGEGAGGLVVDDVGLPVVEEFFDLGIGVEADVDAVRVDDLGDFLAEEAAGFGDLFDLVGVEGEAD